MDNNPLPLKITRLKVEISGATHYMNLTPNLDKLKCNLLKQQITMSMEVLTKIEGFNNNITYLQQKVFRNVYDDISETIKFVANIVQILTNNLYRLRVTENISDYIALIYDNLDSFDVPTEIVVGTTFTAITSGSSFAITMCALNLSVLVSSLLSAGIGIGALVIVGGGIKVYQKFKKKGRFMRVDPFLWNEQDAINYVKYFHKIFAEFINKNNNIINALGCYQEYLNEYVSMFMHTKIKLPNQKNYPVNDLMRIVDTNIVNSNDGEEFSVNLKNMMLYINIVTLKMASLIREGEDPIRFTITSVHNRKIKSSPSKTVTWMHNVYKTLRQLDDGVSLECTLYQSVTDQVFSTMSLNEIYKTLLDHYPEIHQADKRFDDRREEVLTYFEDQVRRIFLINGFELDNRLDSAIQIFNMIECVHPCDKVKYWISGIQNCLQVLNYIHYKSGRLDSMSGEVLTPCIQYMLLKATVKSWYLNQKIMELFYLQPDDIGQMSDIDYHKHLYMNIDLLIHRHLDRDGVELNWNIKKCKIYLDETAVHDIPKDYIYLTHKPKDSGGLVIQYSWNENMSNSKNKRMVVIPSVDKCLDEMGIVFGTDDTPPTIGHEYMQISMSNLNDYSYDIGV